MKTIMNIAMLIASLQMPLAHAFNVERQVFCLEEGTLVRLGNGQEKTIESLDESDAVMNLQHENLPLLMRIIGPEKSSLYRVTLRSGKSVVATGDHPFYTDEGLVITPSEMVIGQSLKTIDGADPVAGLLVIAPTKKVYTLILVGQSLFENATRGDSISLGNRTIDWREQLRREDPFLDLKANQHNFFANGIASGDGVIQGGIKR